MFFNLLIIFQLLGLISSFDAIIKARTTQGAIAWALALNTVSIISVPAYWIFGRNKFQGYVNAHRVLSVKIKEQFQPIIDSFSRFIVEVPDNFPEYEAIKSLAQFPFLKGNDVELLINGDATFDSIYKGIEDAEDYILFQFYIFRADEIGNKFKKILKEKAQDGLRVYVLYDELGSSDLERNWIKDFESAGVKFLPFNTRYGTRNRFQLNFRNHRKNVVVDGKVAWVGGLNIGDDYLGKDIKLSPWRDTHIKISGPSALMAQYIFLYDWNWANHSLINDLSWEPYAAKTLTNKDEGKKVLILGSGPADELETASLFFSHTINTAKQNIWIATPYFIPDEATMTSLRLALLKKLDVRIITPKLNDNWFVKNAARVYLSELEKLGAKIYLYDDGFMHQKVMLIDSKVSIIGTVNFDNRSFRLNFEVSGIVADKSFAKEVENMLLKDISNSIKVENINLSSQSFWEKLKSHGSALLSPLL